MLTTINLICSCLLPVMHHGQGQDNLKASATRGEAIQLNLNLLCLDSAINALFEKLLANN